MKHLWTIIKKEIKRYFTDPRMILSIILPGLIIFIAYSLMGNIMNNVINKEENNYSVYIKNEPEEFKIFLKNDNWKVTYIDEELTDEQAKEKIINKEIDLYIVYEENFYSNVINNTSISNVDIFYNSSKDSSVSLYNYYSSCLNEFENSLTNRFDINHSLSGDLAKKEDISVRLITSFLPFLLIVLLFSGSMGFCCEAIAGEKERGTIATILSTPIKRYEFILGKVCALSLISLCSGTISLIGLCLSLPKLMGSYGSVISFNMYNFNTIFMLLLIILTTVLLFTALILIISTFAKSVKEASSYASPLMILVMGIGVSAFMQTTASGNLLLYFIPIYNSVQSLIGVFSMTLNLPCFIITICSNLVYISLIIAILNKMFNSEKIMFNK